MNMGAAVPWSVPPLAFSLTRLPNSLKVMTRTRSKIPFAFKSLQKAASEPASSFSNRFWVLICPA